MPCSGSIAKQAVSYPKELCRAVLRGVTEQFKEDGLFKDSCFGVQVDDDEKEIGDTCQGPEQRFSGWYRDDLTGQVLKDELVTQARLIELAFFNKKGVWIKVPISEARR